MGRVGGVLIQEGYAIVRVAGLLLHVRGRRERGGTLMALCAPLLVGEAAEVRESSSRPHHIHRYGETRGLNVAIARIDSVCGGKKNKQNVCMHTHSYMEWVGDNLEMSDSSPRTF